MSNMTDTLDGVPVSHRRRLEEIPTADLTRAERQHLLSALTKIHRSAFGLLEELPGEDPAGA
jgi:hypothetical protein